MKFFRTLALATALLTVIGTAEAAAQAFFPTRIKGTVEVKFLPPAGGQTVQVAIDDQPVGTLPVTVYVLPGAHKFTFTATGEAPKTLTYPVKGDTVVPSVFNAKAYPLTVNTNVPGAQLAVDGAPFPGNTTSVAAGNHTLTVTAPGYQTLSLPFVQPSQANTLNITLVASTGTLAFNLDRLPKTGQAYKIFVDNQEVRGLAQALLPGTHTVRIQSGNLSLETVVTVAAGQSQTLIPSVQWELR